LANNIRIVVAFALLSMTITALMPGLALGQSSPLNVTVVTDQPSYNYRGKVQVKGNLTLNGGQVDGLVGLEVNSLNASYKTAFAHMVARTALVGNPPTTGRYNMTLVSVIPIAANGTPVNTFRKNGKAYVSVTVTNYYYDDRAVVITVFAADSDSTPIMSRVMSLRTTLLGGGGGVVYSPEFYIDSWVSTGPAKFYANVYSDWPSSGGYPYTPEKSANFTILPAVGSGYSTSYRQTLATGSPTIESGSAYALSFRLPPNAPQGEYMVNATGWAQGYTPYASTTFNRTRQALGDINLNHYIDIFDVVSVTNIYGAKSGDSNWDPMCDLVPDGVINILDVVSVTEIYGQKY
jgi:hypothetical protein